MKRQRRLLLSLILSLPALLLAGWFLYEQLPVLFPAAPVWLRPDHPDAVPGACEAVASLRAFNGTFENARTGIDAEGARLAADFVIAQTYDLPPGRYTAEQATALVRARFPDAGERLAWLNVAPLDTGESRLGKAAIVYIDAQTGEPLALITAPAVTDARTACGGPPVSRRVLLRQYLPLLLLAGYVGIIGIMTAVALLRRRWKRAATATT